MKCANQASETKPPMHFGTKPSSENQNSHIYILESTYI